MNYNRDFLWTELLVTPHVKIRMMPELPEVETVRRRLAEILPGKNIQTVQVLREKSFQGDIEKLLDQPILEITRRAKLIRIHFPHQLNLLTHLKMTGQLIYLDDQSRVGGGHPTADWVLALPSSHTRIIYQFDDQSQLFFNDQRVFGWMQVMNDEEIAAMYQKYGPDVTDKSLTVEYLQDKLSQRRIPIKQALMMNEIMAGVGNIYASDALNVAQISPMREARSLNQAELKKLLAAVKSVINEALEQGGTTFDGKYVDVDGLAGGYQHRLKAYGREGERCWQCGGQIEKIKIGGRGTYYCPTCQS